MLGHAENVDNHRLCGKVEKLDAKISAMKKQDSVSPVSSQTDTTCGINPLDEHSAPLPHDVNSIGNGTNNAPMHYDIVDLSMQPDNTSATVSYLNDMLEGLEESITDEVIQSVILRNHYAIMATMRVLKWL